jgi:hypothetical protein
MRLPIASALLLYRCFCAEGMTASERKRLWSYLLPRLQSSEGRSMMPFCQDSYDETS